MGSGPDTVTDEILHMSPYLSKYLSVYVVLWCKCMAEWSWSRGRENQPWIVFPGSEKTVILSTFLITDVFHILLIFYATFPVDWAFYSWGNQNTWGQWVTWLKLDSLSTAKLEQDSKPQICCVRYIFPLNELF